jgi:Class II Aldolase and Adducin N-terminal domain
MTLDLLAKEVLEANLALVRHHLLIFTWGNASSIDRESGLIAIKPSGLSYETMTASDIVILDLEGGTVRGQYRPSSDTPTHVARQNGDLLLNQVHALCTKFPWSGCKSGCMLRLLRLLLVLVTRCSCSRRDLLLENLALRQQLMALKQKHRRPRVTGCCFGETQIFWRTQGRQRIYQG